MGFLVGIAVGIALAAQWWLLRRYLGLGPWRTAAPEPQETPEEVDDPDWDPAIDDFLTRAASA